MNNSFFITNLNNNFSSFRLSDKIEMTGFVLLPIVSSLIFLCFMVARRGLQAFIQPRYVIRLSLAAGSTIVALFPMHTSSVLHSFEKNPDRVDCVAFKLARVYDLVFIPVAYSIGLILLAIDIFMRAVPSANKPMLSCLSKLMVTPPFALLVAAFPWITALVVFPLVLSEIDKDKMCHSEQSHSLFMARLIVCGIGPVCVALVTVICCTWLTGGNSTKSSAFCCPIRGCNVDPQNTAAKQTLSTSTSKKDIRIEMERSNVIEITPGNVNYVANNETTTTKTNVVNKHKNINNPNKLQGFGHQENNVFYYNWSVRLDMLIILTCCVILIIAIVIHASLCLKIVEQCFCEYKNFTFNPDKETLMAITVNLQIACHFPVIAFLISFPIERRTFNKHVMR